VNRQARKFQETIFFWTRNFLLGNLLCASGVFAQTEPAKQTIVTNQTAAQVSTENNRETANSDALAATPETVVAPPFVEEELIHLGDVIDVDVLGSVEYDWRGQLDSEGFLSALPFAATSVFALCSTEREVAGSVVAAYTKVLRDPQVVVRVVDRSAREQARLLGAIRTPVRLQIERPVKLNEAIILAGGITERASGEIKIFRPANLSCAGLAKAQANSDTLSIKISDLLAGKPEANPLIHTGDVVTIEEASPIYVTGGVSAPQTVFYRGQKMTLTRALASAGGVLSESDATKIYVYRRAATAAGNTKIYLLNLEKIRKKQDADFELEAFDIIEVPSSRAAEREDQARAPVIPGWEKNESAAQNLPLRVIN
jgi:protein involved in polysaccharide export with SLBB domain